ncbi:AAA family ATPase [Paraburkholderia sp. MMS20-SJTR3]|uniref:AAA family ATPase n=1 Tax=Paraburkholderia sejongensis TaxID=2886946 RepID=A0ABS8JVB0_9BURK|nr:AAA family ATPase [Paraburkholderia sp. MMS20-SJTR3]MCC8393836.1 AAA family ATPase [Paraburkholderia sp. MMS20-SJTR3]
MGNVEITDASCGPLSIRLLGELELTRGGARVPLPASRRTRALLGYLVLTGAPVSRSALCDMLWEGPDDPRAALRWSLSKLRPLLDDAWHERIVASRTHVAFEAAGAFIDAIRLEALLRRGAERTPVAELQEAAQLLRGDLLAGLELPGCYRFYNWCVGQRERFGRIRGTVLRALIRALAPDVSRALQYGHELVDANPLDESGHAALVALLEAADRHADAQEHHHYARELLQREVGARACASLDEAVRRMRDDTRRSRADHTGDRVQRDVSRMPEEGLRTAVQSWPASTGEDQVLPLPLVGREAERARLRDLLAPSSDAGTLTLLTGEPGIGKTRLLEYFSQCASSAACRVLRARCYEAEAIRPYGIWIDALRDLASDAVPPVDEALAPLVHATGNSTSDLQRDEGGRERLFEAVLALLGRLSAEQRLAFVLDDLQWLDEASAALLHFVLRHLAPDLPVVFVAAARPAEMEDNRYAATLLQSLARESKVTHVGLGPLSADDVAALLGAARCDLPLAQATKGSGGNPLYVLELARANRAHPQASTLTVEALIADRLTPINARTRDLLSFAASIGRGFAPERLAQLLDRPLAEVLSSLADLQRRGLMTAASQTEFDFTHDLVRETVYRMLSQPHRRAIHRQIAQQLLASSTRDPRLHGEVVHHATLAGDSRMTALACVEASHHCLTVFAPSEARAVADRGLVHARSLPRGRERIRLEIQLLTARLVSSASSGDACPASMEHEFEDAIQEAEALSLHADVVQGLHSLSWLTQQANDVERTRDVTIRAATAARKADATTRCKQLANTGRCLLELERDLPRARSVLQEAQKLAELLDLRVVELMWGAALLARADGALDAGSAQLNDAVRQARAIGDHWREYQCLVWLATVDFERGAYLQVTQLAGAIVVAARRMGYSGAPYAEVLSAIASFRLTGSDVRDAGFEGLGALREADDKRHLCYVLSELALTCLDRQASERAIVHAREALEAAEILNSPTGRIVATSVLVEAALVGSELESAESLLASLRELLAGEPISPRSQAALQRLHKRYPATTTIVQTQAD